MRIFTKKTLREFWDKHPDAKPSLQHWYEVTRRANWETFSDVRRDFGSADAVGTCVVFDIAGNKYRMITRIQYRFKAVYIRVILTHKEYDKGGWKDGCVS